MPHPEALIHNLPKAPHEVSVERKPYHDSDGTAGSAILLHFSPP